MQTLNISSPTVQITDEHIISNYTYRTTQVESQENGQISVTPVEQKYVFKTQKRAPKTGVMFVGLGGNNGTTVYGAILANQKNVTWNTKSGEQKPDYFGSITQASTVRVGCDTKTKKEVFVPLNSLVPMVHPNDLVVGGWDISAQNLGDAMRRAEVFDYDLQNKLYPLMKDMKPLPGIYRPDFIAANQSQRADNALPQDQPAKEHVETIRKDIRDFKQNNNLDKVIILWTANTERFAEIKEGLNDTAENLLKSIDSNESEVSPSTLYAVASIMEGCSYINGSPQNTFVPGLIELASSKKVYIGGDDFKSGQTKLKSVLVDFLVSAGIKPESIVSYNHLGNNDGKNLSAPKTFRSKEISKRGVVDDMVESNHILFKKDEHPDHVIVIKYVPFVGDSKRAMDEYTSKIFMGGLNTLVIHNTCEDSLLAAPLIIDLVLLTEFFERVQFKMEGEEEFHGFDSILSVLSYLLKAPLVPKNTPLVNSLFRQKACINNILKTVAGIPVDDEMLFLPKW
mmetsp:Transcript_10158/g.37807  ORF Transcript_10158/g.37807 Transcript_10158/m.37807 type:complete len:511 (-) Transcript_10158:203-1735(-)